MRLDGRERACCASAIDRSPPDRAAVSAGNSPMAYRLLERCGVVDQLVRTLAEERTLLKCGIARRRGAPAVVFAVGYVIAHRLCSSRLVQLRRELTLVIALSLTILPTLA